jgi:hypothetical protein
MTETTAAGHEFADEALYLDGHGDTWQYHEGLAAFLFIRQAGSEPITGPLVLPHYEDAESWARDCGPMTRIPGGRPCAECPETAPVGRAYCSTRCRNAADDHNDYGGDL